MSQKCKRGGTIRRAKRLQRIIKEKREDRERRLMREQDLERQRIQDLEEGRIEWGRRLPVRYEE